MTDEFDRDDADVDYLAYNNRRYESLTDAFRHRKISDGEPCVDPAGDGGHRN